MSERVGVCALQGLRMYARGQSRGVRTHAESWQGSGHVQEGVLDSDILKQQQIAHAQHSKAGRKSAHTTYCRHHLPTRMNTNQIKHKHAHTLCYSASIAATHDSISSCVL